MIGLIGGGYWGKNLIRNFHDLGALAIVCDSNMDALKRVQAQYPDVQVTQTFSNLINDPDKECPVLFWPIVVSRLAKKEISVFSVSLW